jgi:hypothetical protein
MDNIAAILSKPVDPLSICTSRAISQGQHLKLVVHLSAL